MTLQAVLMQPGTAPIVRQRGAELVTTISDPLPLTGATHDLIL